MNSEEILKKALSKAYKNGLDEELFHLWSEAIECHFPDRFNGFEIIFNHNFAERVLDDDAWYYFRDPSQEALKKAFEGKGWKYHIQQMVLEEDPIQYLEEFLRN